jgi:hypothetical protein
MRAHAFRTSAGVLDLGPVESMLARTQRRDPTAGRIETVTNALDRLSGSPVLGFGYLSEGSRFENGLLSMALETGAFGTLGFEGVGGIRPRLGRSSYCAAAATVAAGRKRSPP